MHEVRVVARGALRGRKSLCRPFPRWQTRGRVPNLEMVPLLIFPPGGIGGRKLPGPKSLCPQWVSQVSAILGR